MSHAYGAEPETVQTVGRSVHDLGTDADGAVQGVLNSYDDAAGAVHHPSVVAALNTYRSTHQKGHLSFPEAVRGLGSNTAHGGATIADGNNEATAMQRLATTDQEGLVRDINRPLE